MADDLRTVADGRDDGARVAGTVTRLAVLPFRLLRPDPDVDFLSFSLADAIAASLSSVESLIVRPPLAAARFGADVPDLTAIATTLNVDVVVTGTQNGERRTTSALSEAGAV